LHVPLQPWKWLGLWNTRTTVTEPPESGSGTSGAGIAERTLRSAFGEAGEKVEAADGTDVTSDRYRLGFPRHPIKERVPNRFLRR